MGGDLDNVTQGAAGADQFRTAPLWGAGQRFFFMHDGRATNLSQAIVDHCIAPPVGGPVSEACSSVTQFNNLTVVQQQDILNFMRSL